MDKKKKKAWFARVGPFGGLLPQTWQGGIVLLIGVAPIFYFGLGKPPFGIADTPATTQIMGLLSFLSFVLL